MPTFKVLATMFAVFAMMFGLATTDAAACVQPFDVINDTGQNITKITIHFCNGSNYDITGIGPNNDVHASIPCGDICSVTVQVNHVDAGTVTVHNWTTLPSFPGGVYADQTHVHFFP